MTELVRGPNGEYGDYTPGRGVEIISREEYEMRTSGRGSRFVGALGDRLQDAVGEVIEYDGGMNLLNVAAALTGNRGATSNATQRMGQELQAENDSEQALRGQVDPAMSLAGNVAGFATEALIPGAGASRAGRAAAGSVSPGAARGVALGRQVVDASQSVANRAGRELDGQLARLADDVDVANQALGRGPWSADAPGSASGAGMADNLAGGSRGLQARIGTGNLAREAGEAAQRAGTRDAVSEAERLGFKLTPADKTGVDALKNRESAMRSSPSVELAFERNIMNPNRDRMADLARKAMGLEGGSTITPADLGQAVDNIQQGFNSLASRMKPVDVRDGLKGNTLVAKGVTEDAKATIQSALDNLPSGMQRPDQVFELLSRLRRQASGFQTQGRLGEADALGEIADTIERRLTRGQGKEVKDTLKRLREQWRIAELMQRGNVISADGDINLGSMRNAFMNSRYTRDAFRRGRGFNTAESEDFANAVQVMSQFQDRIGNSGTATRSMNMFDPRELAGYPAAQAYLTYGGSALSHVARVAPFTGGAAGAGALLGGGGAAFGD